MSFQCIQIYYISITLGWFVSTYMPITANFSSYDQDDKYANDMENLVARYYVINHCLSCLIPELCINFLFLRYYMQQAHVPQPQSLIAKYFIVFGIYIVLCIGFNGICSFGIADMCSSSWYNLVSLGLDFLPQVFGIVMMVKIILALKNRVEYADVIDITAIIAQKKQHKLLAILIIRIWGASIMLIWNLILLFVAF